MRSCHRHQHTDWKVLILGKRIGTQDHWLTKSSVSRCITRKISSSPDAGWEYRLTSEFIFTQNSQVLSQANEGAEGNTNLIANVVLVITQDSIIDASSQLGISGDINIASPVQYLSEAIAKRPETIRVVAGL